MKPRPIMTYILPPFDDPAVLENFHARKQVMEKAGYRVLAYRYERQNEDSKKQLTALIRKSAIVCIRIDGSGYLDTLSLLKISYPDLRIIWEIHGWKEEHYYKIGLRTGIRIMAHRLKRYALSFCTEGYIFVSEELAHHSKTFLMHRTSAIIPNFIPSSGYLSAKHSSPPRDGTIQFSIPQNQFIVLWAGSAQYPWHALDVIENAARLMYKKDRNVRFVIVGPRPRHMFSWFSNIIFCEPVPSSVMDMLIAKADVCLALYRKPLWCPMYFSPLKILRYISNKKPVIASTAIARHMGIIDNVTGYATDNSASEIVTIILRLKHNRKLRQEIGNRAYTQIASRRSEKNAIMQYRSFLSRFFHEQ